MAYTKERLGELLVQAKLISEQQLQAALARQTIEGGKLGEVLVRELLVTEEQIAEALADQKGYEHVNLTAVAIDRATAMMMPLRVARRRLIIPIEIVGDRLRLAMADPLDIEAIDDAELLTGMRVDPVVVAVSQVRFAIEKYIAGGDALHELQLAEDTATVVDEHDAEDVNVPVVRIVNQIIHEAVVERASDIHFEPADDGVHVRYRVDGVLRNATTLPRRSQAELISRIKVMADLDITERRRPQDGRISVRVDDAALDLRVATLPTPQGESITLRVLDSAVAFLPIDKVGLSEEDFERVSKMLRKPYGALFVSGPTGSGKSTTLYALLNEIADNGRKTITVEDPVEYRMEGITQIAVNPRIGLTFAAGLRTILRSDPDIVMVGEVRDPETAEMAVRSALTGHLVLTSIHTNDAPSALTRLNDMGVAPYITSSGLLGAVAQRLVRVLCPKCKKRDKVSWDTLVAAGYSEEEAAGIEAFTAVGCDECGNTGYKGRIGVFEVMEFDEPIATAYLHDATAEALREIAIERGMRTLRRDALDKVAAGVTSLAEIDRVVV